MTASGRRLERALARYRELQEMAVVLARQLADAKQDVREAREQLLADEARGTTARQVEALQR